MSTTDEKKSRSDSGAHDTDEEVSNPPAFRRSAFIHTDKVSHSKELLKTEKGIQAVQDAPPSVQYAGNVKLIALGLVDGTVAAWFFWGVGNWGSRVRKAYF